MNEQRGPRGPYRKGVERRAQIVESASRVFAAEGYHGTLKQVADLVGVTPAAVVALFGSKEGLLIEVLQAWGTAQLPPSEPTGVEDHLASWRRLMTYHVAHRGLLRLYLRLATEATSPSHPAHGWIVERNRATVHGLESHLRAAAAAGEIADLGDARIAAEARNLLAVVEGLEMQWILDERVDLVGLVSLALEQALGRLRPGSPDPKGAPDDGAAPGR